MSTSSFLTFDKEVPYPYPHPHPHHSIHHSCRIPSPIPSWPQSTFPVSWTINSIVSEYLISAIKLIDTAWNLICIYRLEFYRTACFTSNMFGKFSANFSKSAVSSRFASKIQSRAHGNLVKNSRVEEYSGLREISYWTWEFTATSLARLLFYGFIPSALFYNLSTAELVSIDEYLIYYICKKVSM